jgi:hypothetical protein
MEISVSTLGGLGLSQFNAEQRLGWAKNRKTTREEDWGYSLLGIFEISILVICGERRTSEVKWLENETEDIANDKKCLRHVYVTDPRADKIRTVHPVPM